MLHARAILVRFANLASREERTVDRRGIRLPAMTAHALNAWIERRVAGETRIDRERAGNERGGDSTFGGKESCKRERCRNLRAVE